MMTYVYNNNVVSPFSWGVSMGDGSKNVSNNFVSNNFVPFVFFPDGEGYMYVRPLLHQKPRPGRFTFGGWVTSPRTPLRTPPRTLRIGGLGGGKNC